VVSILLSTATTGGTTDTDTISIANNNGYNLPGLDAMADRSNSRAGYAYYEGIPIPGPGLYQFRLVIVNMLAGSPSHQPYEILFNENTEPLNTAATTAAMAAARAAIDSVQAAPAGTTYAAWKTGHSFPAGQDGPNDDPDRDGWSNLFEFQAGTDPLDPASRPTSILTKTPAGFTYTYRRAKDRIGIVHTLETGPLDSLTTFTPSGETFSDLAPNIEQVTVPLAPDFGPFLRQVITPAP